MFWVKTKRALRIKIKHYLITKIILIWNSIKKSIRISYKLLIKYLGIWKIIIINRDWIIIADSSFWRLIRYWINRYRKVKSINFWSIIIDKVKNLFGIIIKRRSRKVFPFQLLRKWIKWRAITVTLRIKYSLIIASKLRKL